LSKRAAQSDDPMSDTIIVQLIASTVTLIALWIHRKSGSRERREIAATGSRENREIAETINGQRTALVVKIESLEKEVLKLTGDNMKLTTQAEDKRKP